MDKPNIQTITESSRQMAVLDTRECKPDSVDEFVFVEEIKWLG